MNIKYFEFKFKDDGTLMIKDTRPYNLNSPNYKEWRISTYLEEVLYLELLECLKENKG